MQLNELINEGIRMDLDTFTYNNNNKSPLTPKSMPPAGDEHAKLKT